MIQSLEEIESHYAIKDPWGYQSNPEDIKRKHIIIDTLKKYGPFDLCLDIGAGEGWITKDLPAKSLYGYELSKIARSRMSKEVIPLAYPPTDIKIKFDLVVATGILYSHYDYVTFFEIISKFSSRIILTCNIMDWERKEMNSNEFLKDRLGAREILSKEFQYRQYTQKLRVLEVIK